MKRAAGIGAAAAQLAWRENGVAALWRRRYGNGENGVKMAAAIEKQHGSWHRRRRRKIWRNQRMAASRRGRR